MLYFNILLFLSGILGIAITMFVMLAYTVCLPLTVNVSMVFKDVLMTWISFVMFDDQKATLVVIVGTGLSLLGGILYIRENYYLTIAQSLKKKD